MEFCKCLFLITILLLALIVQIIQLIVEKYAQSPERKLADLQNKYNDLEKDYQLKEIVIEAINNVVLEKRARFATTCLALRTSNAPITAGAVFRTITNPEAQISELMKGLYNTLRLAFPNVSIKVALMRVTNGALDRWDHFYPRHTTARTTIAQLSDPDSTISHALRTKNIVIVSNVQAEKNKPAGTRRYVSGNSIASENWTQVCDPVLSMNDNEVIYIISIAIKQAEIFTTDDENFVKWMLESFKLRLALEHSLLELKSTAV